MPDPRLDVHIRTSADTSGAKAAAAEVRKAGDAAEQAAKQAQQTAKSVNDAGESFEKGAAAGRVLAGALQGNVVALTQLGPAIKALGTALKANVIGVLVTLGGLLASTLIPLISGFRKKLDETTDSAGKLDDALQLRTQAIEDVSRAISQLTKDADAAEKELRSLQLRNEAIADAELALTLAKIQANENLTDVERLTLETEARAQRARQRRENESETNRRIVELRQGRIDAAQQAVDNVGAQSSAISGFRQDLISQRAAFEEASRRERLQMAQAGAPPAAVEAQARATQQRLDAFDAAIEAAGQESLHLAEALEAARQALQQVTDSNQGAIRAVQEQEQHQQQLFDINQRTAQTTAGTQIRRAINRQRIDTSDLQSRRAALAAEAAQLEAESTGGDFSFGGALRRSAAAEALERNRQEAARLDNELLRAVQQNHAAEMAARKALVDEQKVQKRDAEKLQTEVKNSRP